MQSDLFEIPMDASVSKPSGYHFAFLERYRFTLRLDQAIIATIVMIIVYVLVFSFGVEKGKRFAMAELKAERAKREQMTEEFRDKLLERGILPVQGAVAVQPAVPVNETAVKSTPLPVPAAVVAPKVIEQKETPAIKTYPEGKYTIQMAIFKTQSMAEKTVKALGEKGIQGFFIPKGSHFEVCVSGFATMAQAKKALGDFKVKGIVPADAYIRSIPL